MNPRKIVKSIIPKSLFRKIEPLGHLGEAVLFNTVNGFPAKGLKVIGVTGTNGKTTTCFMIHRMLTDAGYKVGLMTTVAYGVGNDIKPQEHHMTNVAVPELMSRLKTMREAGVDWLILETTSHALAQHRVWGVPYSLAVMTNVTHEHLGYHGSFENYRDAKRQLFKLTNKNKKGLRTGVINAEDPSAKLFAKDITHAITYGVKAGGLRAHKVKMTAAGSTYQAKIGQENYDITCHLPGSFNVFNSLAAIGAGHALGLSKDQIEQGIATLKSVEGRMVRLDEGQPFDVIVDYAHTPDSFEKLFKDLRPMVRGKIIVLFGSLGGGDKGKRPLQGQLAGLYCDEVILAEEDDRQEKGLEIMEDIAKGVEKAGKTRGEDLFLVHDRTEAIKFAFGRAQKGDTVLLLGKGHEKTIERADGEHPWNEAETARKFLSKTYR